MSLWCLTACGQTPCPVDLPVDDAGVDAAVCVSRLYLGPLQVLDPHSGLNGIGLFCTRATVDIAFRVHLFALDGREVSVVDATCGPSSLFLTVGDVAPGEYDVAIESVEANANGSHLIWGTRLLRPLPCLDPVGRAAGVLAPSADCDPIRVVVRACETSVVPASVNCEDSDMGAMCVFR